MKQILEKITSYKFRFNKRWINKYTIAFACFLVWVVVFDKYNYVTQRNLSQTVAKLENEKISYKEKIVETRKQLKDIDLHKEKYARERYYMHKPNEEIIVINQED